MVAVKCNKKCESPSLVPVFLVYAFWATVETWLRNMAHSVEKDPLPM